MKIIFICAQNTYTKSAKLRMGPVKLKHKIQTRQLQASHMHEHCCAAVFRYMCHYAVKYRNNLQIFCMDDNAKINLVQLSGQHFESNSLAALDHDVGSKGSLTPSLSLKVDIPENPGESFYRGQVFVALKDSIFQPSSPFRHAVELSRILKSQDSVKPFLFLYTDLGPDHRVTYGAVRLSLIILFKLLDLDV